jgi:hypothetical protein
MGEVHQAGVDPVHRLVAASALLIPEVDRSIAQGEDVADDLAAKRERPLVHIGV